jgi:N utilization substance protein B
VAVKGPAAVDETESPDVAGIPGEDGDTSGEVFDAPARHRHRREGPRGLARERALGLLYEAALKSLSPKAVLAELAAPPDPFATALIEAVEQNIAQIDRLLSSASVDWELSRMPVVDLSVLRMAVAELICWPETPVAVVLDEAVELAKQYSTEESGRFVNGVLSTVATELRHPVSDA